MPMTAKRSRSPALCRPQRNLSSRASQTSSNAFPPKAHLHSCAMRNPQPQTSGHPKGRPRASQSLEHRQWPRSWQEEGEAAGIVADRLSLIASFRVAQEIATAGASRGLQCHRSGDFVTKTTPGNGARKDDSSATWPRWNLHTFQFLWLSLRASCRRHR